jgi:hypothetical protein
LLLLLLLLLLFLLLLLLLAAAVRALRAAVAADVYDDQKAEEYDRKRVRNWCKTVAAFFVPADVRAGYYALVSAGVYNRKQASTCRRV